MSRHRLIKNLDLNEELDDEAFSDEEDAGPADYDMDDEQRAQMESGLIAVKSMLGNGTLITEADIREALWNYYFDVGESVNYLLDEHHKREQAANRKLETASTEIATDIAHLSIAPIESAPPINGNGTGKLSKLAVRAKIAKLASNLAQSSNAIPIDNVNSSIKESKPPPKPLSKLQLRAQQAKEAQKLKSANASPTSANTLARIQEKAPELVAIPESGLFRQLPKQVNSQTMAGPSAFASVLQPRTSAIRVDNRPTLPGVGIAGPFDTPSPDDVVMNARKPTNSRRGHAEKRKKEKAAAKQTASAPNSGRATPTTSSPKKSPTKSKKPVPGPLSSLQQSIESLGLASSASSEDGSATPGSPLPSQHISLSLSEIIAESERRASQGKPILSLIVIGHVDAGKSTLMGRLLHDLGESSDKTIQNQQRQSQKAGKGSFAYAWTLDALPEERERGVTMDIAVDSFNTPNRQFTLIDAPGHRDFIPNMISGATQADTALLVIDAASNAFESGFSENGQTREHAILVRSLGVQQIVVAVNKLDQVGWDQGRFESIKTAVHTFLTSIGFSATKVFFIPVAAMIGENVASRQSQNLASWYNGPTLAEQLDTLSIPKRALHLPMRFPIGNVFKASSGGPSGLGIAGRIESGVIQVGSKVAILPGDEVATVKSIEFETDRVPWAVAGQYVTIYLANIDPVYVSPGCVLCPTDQQIPVADSFVAQIVVFDLDFPITAGAAIELFHHSKNTPANITQLHALLDKATGEVTKLKPRMLTAGSSAKVTISLRSTNNATTRPLLPVEPFSVNKGMGRVLLRRGESTIAAGVVLEVG